MDDIPYMSANLEAKYFVRVEVNMDRAVIELESVRVNLGTIK